MIEDGRKYYDAGVAPHEFGRAVADRVGASTDRLIPQVSPQVVGQSGHGDVSLRRVLLQRFGDNGVEVPAQHAAKFFRCGRPPRGIPSGQCVADLGHARRFLFKDGLDKVGGGSHVLPNGMAPGEQHEEEHSQRINVRGGCDCLSVQLFRRGIVGRERLSIFECELRSHIDVPFVLQQLGDPEIEQLDLAIGSHQHVGRLEVAVHNKVCVGFGDGLQHIQEFADAARNIEIVFIAVTVDVDAIDMFEHEVWLPTRQHSSIDQFSDVGMKQESEDSAFALETFFSAVSDESEVEELDSHAAFESAILPFGQPHGAHSAAPDLRHQPVDADGLARQR
jgi:hypothetical protein